MDFPIYKQKLLILYCKNVMYNNRIADLFRNVCSGNDIDGSQYDIQLDTDIERSSYSNM